MRRLLTAFGLTLAAWALVPAGTTAQIYSGATPVPRTTALPALRELANQREIVERMRAGFAAERAADWELAEASFARAIALAPREPQASTCYYDLALAQTNLGRLAAAEAALREAIARDPGFLAARANLVGVLLSRGDVAAARSAADAFVAVAPDSARALFARGLIALRQADPGQATRDFRVLLAGNPGSAIAYFELGLAESQRGAYADAERDLRAAIERAPGYERARLTLGVVLLREGSREEARTLFDAVAHAGDDIAIRNLALSLRDAIGP